MFAKVNQSETATISEFGTNQGVRNIFHVNDELYYWINTTDKLDADDEVYIPAFTPSEDAVYEEVSAAEFKTLLEAARPDIIEEPNYKATFFAETGLTDE